MDTYGATAGCSSFMFKSPIAAESYELPAVPMGTKTLPATGTSRNYAFDFILVKTSSADDAKGARLPWINIHRQRLGQQPQFGVVIDALDILVAEVNRSAKEAIYAEACAEVIGETPVGCQTWARYLLAPTPRVKGR